jgi:GNAT superfamily N-acetyltransferase
MARRNRVRVMSEMPFTLRPAACDDLAFASGIYLETMRYVTDRLPDFDEATHMAGFADRFRPEEVRIVVQDGKDVGWLQVSETDDEIFLKQVFLQPESQGRGIGSGLVMDLIERGRRVGKPVRLGVVKINRAVRLYERLGFGIVSEDHLKFYMERSPL